MLRKWVTREELEKKFPNPKLWVEDDLEERMELMKDIIMQESALLKLMDEMGKDGLIKCCHP